MSRLDAIGTGFSLWIDAVAATINAYLERLRPVRRIEVVEDAEGEFTIRMADPAGAADAALQPTSVVIGPSGLAHVPEQGTPVFSEGQAQIKDPAAWREVVRGSKVELLLRSSRFLFRPLELPKGASEFLDGIVRAQIDRLTPWYPTEAVYHWTAPTDLPGGRVSLTVVSTARAAALALAQPFLDFGALAVDIATMAPGADPVRVTVWQQRAGGAGAPDRTRFALKAAFVTAGMLALFCTAASGFVTGYYDAQIRQVERRLSEHRAAMRAGNGPAADSALQVLERRKHATPSSVLVIEALSSLLPEHTYATEVRIEGDKLQIIGLTRDAPALIQILEQSPHFSRAAFFAPTTRAPNEPGERFHIEARIRPYFGASL